MGLLFLFLEWEVFSLIDYPKFATLITYTGSITCGSILALTRKEDTVTTGPGDLSMEKRRGQLTDRNVNARCVYCTLSGLCQVDRCTGKNHLPDLTDITLRQKNTSTYVAVLMR